MAKLSKNQYVARFGSELVANPLAALRGHKIPAAQKKLFSGSVAQGALLIELLYVAHSLKNAAKGSVKALRKADNFCIHTFKTEGQLIDGLDEAVADFSAGLSADDLASFKTFENIHVVGYFPNHESPVQRLKLDTLVRNGYRGKFGKGMFVLFMMANSAIRTTELTLAKSQAKRNKTKAKKGTSPNIIKAKLRKRANNKLASIDKKLNKVRTSAAAVQAQMSEFDAIAKQFGLQGSYNQNASALKMRMKLADKRANKLNNLSATEQALWKVVQRELKKGNKRGATSIIKSSGSEALMAKYRGNVADSGSVISTRSKALKAQGSKLRANVKTLRDRIGGWEIDRADAKASGDAVEFRRIGKNIASAKNRIGKYNKEIANIKSRLGIVKTVGSGNFDSGLIKSKFELSNELSAEIERLTDAGIDERIALQTAIQKIDASDGVKEQLMDEAEAEMDAGTPVKIAAQVAAQQIGEDLDMGLSDEGSIADIVAKYI